MDSAENMFSSGIFLNTISAVYFPGQKSRIEEFHLADKTFRLLVINGKKIITSFPFADFFQGIPGESNRNQRRIDYLPHVVLSTGESSGGIPAETSKFGPEFNLAPLIDWRKFNSWEQFENMLAQRNGKLAYDTRRRTAKLTREKGEIKFIYNDTRPKVFDNCISWKSGHYDKIGGTDIFLDGKHILFFRELQKNKLLIVSSVWAGGKNIAVHLGALWNNIFYYWIPAYDRSYSSYAPGRLLLHYLLQESFTRKNKAFDFLIGAEDYKWTYATHYRIIGPMGKPSYLQILINSLSRLQFAFKSRAPFLYYFLKRQIINFKRLYL